MRIGKVKTSELKFGDNSAQTVAAPPYELPVATDSILGGVKDGTGVTIDGTGVLSVVPGGTTTYAVTDPAITAATVANFEFETLVNSSNSIAGSLVGGATLDTVKVIGSTSLKIPNNNNDGFTIATSTDYEVSGIDFTIDCWLRLSSPEFNTYRPIFGTGLLWGGSTQCFGLYIGQSGALSVLHGSTSTGLGNVSITADTWFHLAVTVANNGATSTTKVYKDGSLVLTGSLATRTWVTGTLPYYIGRFHTPPGFGATAAMWVDRLRLTKAIRFTANFVPDGALVNSTNSLQYNKGGVIAGSSTLVYDETSDRLGIGTSVPTERLHTAGGNWKMEGTAGTHGIVFPDATKQTTAATPYTLPVATSSVLGGVKQGTNVTIAGDGTLNVPTGAGYALPQSSLTTLGGVKPDGLSLNVYDGVATLAEVDVYWSNVLILAHMDGANAGTVFTNSKTGTAMTMSGAGTTSTTAPKFGSASTYFTGAAGYLDSGVGASGFWTGDWTVEAWVKPDAGVRTHGLAGTRYFFSGSGYGAALNFTTDAAGKINSFNIENYNANGSAVNVSANSSAALAWTHLACCRSGTTLYWFVNGIACGTTTGFTVPNNPGNNIYIGNSDNAAVLYPMKGYMDEIRITKGVCRYKTSFDLQTAEFPNYGSIASLAALPVATATVLGGVKQGTNTVIAGDGTISVPLTTGPAGASSQGISQTIRGMSPLGYWRLGEASGTVAIDQMGLNNGTYTGVTLAQTPLVTGETSTATSFTGSAGSYVSVPYTPVLSPSSQLTIMGIVKWSGSVKGQLLSKTEAGGYSLGIDTTTLSFSMYANGSYRYATYALSNFVVGTRYFLAATYDGRYMRLWVNSALVTTTDLGAYYPVVYTSNNWLLIGAEPSGTASVDATAAYFLGGTMSDVAVFGAALSADQIYQINQAVLGVAPIPKSGQVLYASDADPYWYDTVLSMPMDTLLDMRGNSVVSTGNVAINTGTFKVGTGSASFDGTGDYLKASCGDVYWSAGDYTIEAWVYATSWTTWELNSGGVLPAAIGNSDPVGAANYWSFGPIGTGAIMFYYYNGGGVYTAKTTLLASTNQWNHIAMVHKEGTITLYLNGVGQSFAVSGVPAQLSSLGIVIGQVTNRCITGNLDSVRITKAARYTANFTPPLTAFPRSMSTSSILPIAVQGDPYWYDTVLAMPFNTLLDAKGGTVTATGNAAISTSQSKFGGSSYFSDGTGDWLSIPSSSDYSLTSDYTVECWLYPLAIGVSMCIIDTRAVGATVSFSCSLDVSGKISVYVHPTSYLSTGTIVANAWSHLAFVRQGNTGTFYINGVASGTYTHAAPGAVASNMRIGANVDGSYSINGYMQDLRVTRVARYTSNFVPPTSANPIFAYQPLAITAVGPQGAQGVAGQVVFASDADPYWNDVVLHMDMETLYDKKRNTTTVVGSAAISTAQKKFGTKSLYLPNGVTAGSLVTVPYTTEFNLRPSAGFTIEAWIYLAGNALPDGNSLRNATIFGLTIPGTSTQLNFWVMGNTTTTGTGLELEFANVANYVNGRQQLVTISQGVWHHVALCMDQNSTRFYFNGVQYTQLASTYDIPWTGSTVVSIGRAYPDALQWSRHFNGYIDDLRVTNGVARYTSSFTVPTVANPTSMLSASVIPLASQGDPYWSNVDLSLPLDTLLDNTGNSVVSTGAAISTNQSRFGTKSCYFDGASTYLDVNMLKPSTSGLYTIEGWVYIQALPTSGNSRRIFETSGTLGGRGINLTMAATAPNYLGWYGSSDGTSVDIFNRTTATTLAIATWYHFAQTYDGTTYKLYLNGNLLDSVASATKISNTATHMYLGGQGTGCSINGYLSDVRVTSGVVRYATNFTPPTAAYPTIAYQPVATAITGATGASGQLIYASDADPFWVDTTLAMHMNDLVDIKGSVVTKSGSAVISASQFKFGTASAYFPAGTSNNFSIPASNALNMGQSDFTIDFWVRLDSVPAASAYQFILSQRTNYNVNESFTFAFYGDTPGTLLIMEMYDSVNAVRATGASVPFTTFAWAANTWYHIAFVRSGTSLKTYVNGSVKNAVTVAATFTVCSSTVPMILGDLSSGASMPMKGYLDDFRITKAARWTSDFTAPTSAFAHTLVSASVVPIASQGDPYWYDTVLSMSMDSLVDLKGNAVTAFGNAAISTAQSKFGGKSCYFDGSGDYLRVALPSTVQPVSCPFTIDGWVYMVGSGNQALFDWRGDGSVRGILCYVSTGTQLNFLVSDSNVTSWEVALSAPLSANNWNHFAFQRDSNNVWTMYLNGVSVSTATWTGDISFNGSTYITLGNDISGTTYQLNGYLDDFRITKGVARYGSNFVPPTVANPVFAYQPLALASTAVGTTITGAAGTSANVVNVGTPAAPVLNFTIPKGDATLLGSAFKYIMGTFRSAQFTANNTPLVNYTNNFGAPDVSFFNKTTGEYTAQETGYYQVICSLQIDVTVNRTILAIYVNGANTKEVLDFTNQQYSDSGATLVMYLQAGDKVSLVGFAAPAPTAAYAYLSIAMIGQNENYVTPVSSQGDPYWYDTVLSMSMDSLTDKKCNVVTTFGNTVVSTAQKKFGTGSAYFDGTGDYLTVPKSDDFNFASEDFTIEVWAYLVSYNVLSRSIFSMSQTVGPNYYGVRLAVGGTNRLSLGVSVNGTSQTAFTDTTDFPLGRFVHLAVTRTGDTYRVFVDGLIAATGTLAGSVYYSTSDPVCIGTDPANGGVGYDNKWHGYLDDLRVTKGVSRYTAAFTPPSVANPTVSYQPLAVIPLSVISGATVVTVGSTGQYQTLRAAVEAYKDYFIKSSSSLTFQLAGEVINDTAQTVIDNPTFIRAKIVGATPIDITITSIASTSGSAGAWSQVLNVSSTAGLFVGAYMLMDTATGGTNPARLYGCHAITAIGTNQITVLNKNKHAAVGSGAVTGTARILTSILKFPNNACSGIVVASTLGGPVGSGLNNLVVANGGSGWAGLNAITGGIINCQTYNSGSAISLGFDGFDWACHASDGSQINLTNSTGNSMVCSSGANGASYSCHRGSKIIMEGKCVASGSTNGINVDGASYIGCGGASANLGPRLTGNTTGVYAWAMSMVRRYNTNTMDNVTTSDNPTAGAAGNLNSWIES